MTGGTLYAIAFYAVAAVAVASALMVVWHKHPVMSALFLVVCFFSVAVTYVLLHAHFLAAVQVLLYAGAVLVLFLMIIMLINQDPAEIQSIKPTLGRAIGAAAAAGFIVVTVVVLYGFGLIHMPKVATPHEVALFLMDRGYKPARLGVGVKPEAVGSLGEDDKAQIAKDVLIWSTYDETQLYIEWPERFKDMTEVQINNIAHFLVSSIEALPEGEPLEEIVVPSDIEILFKKEEDSLAHCMDYIEAAAMGRLRQFNQFGTTKSVGRVLFSRYILAFEAASLLLLAAIVGVIVLARRGPGEDES